MTAHTGAYLDQIVFQWSATSLLGTRGVGPVATSLPYDGLRHWADLLRTEIWAAAEPPGSPPGIAYLRYAEEAAVLRKWPVQDATGRPGSTFTHALVGPAAALTPEAALAYAHWEGWLDPGDPLPAGGALEAFRWSPTLRAPLPRPDPVLAAEAAAVVDRVLRCPSARYTVVAPASDPLGLAQVVLGVARGFGADPWTFATRESDDAGREATRLIILTAEPEFSSHGVPRERIAPAGAPAAPLAETLVAAYLRSGSEGMERIRPSRPLTDPARVRRWAKAVQRAPGVLDDAFLLATAAARGRLSPRERDYLASAEGRGQVAAMIARFPDAELVELVRLWAEGRTDPVTEAVSAELERRLARAGGRRSRGVLARWRHAIPVLVAVVVLAVAAGFVLFATARLWR